MEEEHDYPMSNTPQSLGSEVNQPLLQEQEVTRLGTIAQQRVAQSDIVPGLPRGSDEVLEDIAELQDLNNQFRPSTSASYYTDDNFYPHTNAPNNIEPQILDIKNDLASTKQEFNNKFSEIIALLQSQTPTERSKSSIKERSHPTGIVRTPSNYSSNSHGQSPFSSSSSSSSRDSPPYEPPTKKRRTVPPVKDSSSPSDAIPSLSFSRPNKETVTLTSEAIERFSDHYIPGKLIPLPRNASFKEVDEIVQLHIQGEPYSMKQFYKHEDPDGISLRPLADGEVYSDSTKRAWTILRRKKDTDHPDILAAIRSAGPLLRGPILKGKVLVLPAITDDELFVHIDQQLLSDIQKLMSWDEDQSKSVRKHRNFKISGNSDFLTYVNASELSKKQLQDFYGLHEILQDFSRSKAKEELELRQAIRQSLVTMQGLQTCSTALLELENSKKEFKKLPPESKLSGVASLADVLKDGMRPVLQLLIKLAKQKKYRIRKEALGKAQPQTVAKSLL